MTELNLSATDDDRWIEGARGASRVLDDAAGYVGSLALHALLIFLLLFGIAVEVGFPESIEIPVDIVVEPPPPPPPPPPAPPQVVAPPVAPPQAASGDHSKSARGVPDVADEDQKAQAPKADMDRNGEGKDEKRDGADPDAGENAEPFQRRDDAQLIAPVAPANAHRKLVVAPLGPAMGKTTVRKPDPAAKGEQTTVKRGDITCGAKARAHFTPEGRILRAEVLGFLTRGQSQKVIENMQAARDLHMTARYADHQWIFVHIEGRPPDFQTATSLPVGSSVQVGDHVELRLAYPDPSAPCHYIPSEVLRVF